MYQFVWPFVFLLLPLPLILRQLLSASNSEQQAMPGALKVPFFERLKKLGNQRSVSHRALSPLLWTLVWILFVTAAARPVWIGDPIMQEKEVRNIVLTMDVSGSMEEEDFDVNGRPMTRLNMVKHLAQDFIQKRKGDNLGLVIFGSEAYTYTPLSPDTKSLLGLMDEIGIGIAGNQTAMGDGLALAVQTVASVPEKARIVILMSDGFANAGVVQLEEALQLAKKSNVKVYTIGIGSDRQTIQDFLGFVQINPSLDLDEDALKHVAAETGGQYFRAKTTADLQKIYNLIDELETTKAEETTIRPRKEMAYWFILAGLTLWMLGFLIGGRA
ncbi:MAG: VWA domain-containing protein [Alphaproteobacteria bacterium]|nr:VWA domain-containing protein [Alphaproteobacteria bacterium]